MATGTTKRSKGVTWARQVTRKRMPYLSRRVDQSLELKCGSEGLVFRLVWTGACAGKMTDSEISWIILQTPQFWPIRTGTRAQGEREQECEGRTDGF